MSVVVELIEITRDNLDEVLKLDAADGGKQVAPNVRSMAQAAVYAEAWPRAIAHEGVIVGFVMLNDPSLAAEAEEPDYAIWRLMIDKSRQGQGLGAAAVRAVIAHLRANRPDSRELYLSYVEGVASAERFYRSLGFEPTGEVDDGEVVMRLPLRTP